MISDTTNDSWHPAFMPNSIAEPPAPKSTAMSATPPHSINDTSLFEPQTEPKVSLSEETVSESDQLAESAGQDNTNHAELTNLRDALTTSLSSPGGVEMDENPLHTASVQEEAERTHLPESPRADFPSEGPKHDSKHQSTTSFARTAQEVNWGEEDEVDPEWNLHRTDTDPFKMMAQSDRTNSFPAVPSLQSWNVNIQEQPLPHSQAEEIVDEVEKSATDLFGDNGTDGQDEFFAQQAFSPEDTLPTDNIAESHASLDQGQSYGGDVRPEEDEESQARFEEGIPLVQAQDSSNPIQPSTDAFASSFADDGIEDDFFANVNNPPEQDLTSRPDGITRKTTVQVIDSLDFQSQAQVQEDILEEQEQDVKADTRSNSESSIDKATGGGLGASKSTILAQVLSESDTPNSGLDGVEAWATTGEGHEDDLAAKWKAALEEDEFLEDNDELLDDESAEGDPVDPAAFFGSDDEGFLEETDEFDNSNGLSHETASPLPTPVMDSNGKVMGFDNLTGSAHKNRTSSGSRYLPAGVNNAQTQQPRNPYGPTTSVLADLSKSASSPTVASPYLAPALGFPGQQQQQQTKRPELPKTQSFADKAKGGYASPYDLPMEVVKPRQRAPLQNVGRSVSAAPAMAPPPPRSSSRPSQIQVTGPATTLSPPTSSHGPPSSNAPPRSASLQSKGGFFEDLPMVSRPKATTKHAMGLASPGINGPSATGNPPQSSYLPSQPSPMQQQGQPALPAQSPYLPQPQGAPQLQNQRAAPHPPLQGLVAPDRVSPYASLPSSTIHPPAISSRYSPAPPQPSTHSAPPAASQSRYSPAPPPQRIHAPPYAAPAVNAQPSTPILAHQPRTSSPLAHFERSSQNHRAYSSGDAPLYDRRSSSSGYEPSHRTNPLSPSNERDEFDQANRNDGHSPNLPANSFVPGIQGQSQLQRQSPQTPPPASMPPKQLISPSKRAMSNYQPQQANNTIQQREYVPTPPKRSQTQSPGSAFAGPRLEMITSEPPARPASVQAPSSPHLATASYAPMNPIVATRPRGFSQGLNYVVPTDGRETDPLQRWRGAPVFAWGVGGVLVTSFPQDVPRYGMNQSMPMIVRSPGEVKMKNIKEVSPLEENLSKFPGPLKGKAKKKELLAWLSSGIANLEQNNNQSAWHSIQPHNDKRTEERILLWKVLHAFIEHDGILEGTPVVDNAVRAILSPGLGDDASQAAPMYSTGADLSGISASTSVYPRADTVDPAAVDQLRKHLLRGEREKAVWEAVDKRLWAHAMLISNTVSRDLYRQVAQEFVQKEVKIVGENTESLAALYEIFAGNYEESIDELVPPSARAGFQMVSTSAGSGPSKDALAGLDRWRETLSLVLSNRSTDDGQALNALGKLLSSYGRAEAAHICFLFARSYSVFGGIDDPLSSIVLVGSDHQQQPYGIGKELEPILLSEVYEYGLTLSSASVSSLSMPHLAVYKLQHATMLAEFGYRDRALQYCEAIASSITSQTKRSPYHHALLVAALDDLSKRLKQSPKDESSSWISKPSIDKVSGSVWAKFSNFVAGDENDATTNGTSSGGAEIGPFARIAGGTPTISRSPSVTDLNGTYGSGVGMISPNGAMAIPQNRGSRYAPGAGYTPAHDSQLGSSYGSQPRSSLEQRSSGELKRPYAPLSRQPSDYMPMSQPGSQSSSYVPQSNMSFTPQPIYGSYGGGDSPYAQYAENASPYVSQSPGTPVTDHPAPSNVYDSPQSFANSDLQPTNSYNPGSSFESRGSSSSFEPPPTTSGYDPSSSNSYEAQSSGGYEPPSGSGYEPPSYTPAAMNDEPDSPIDTKPKKKNFMDDDDDDYNPGPKASGEKTKAEKDREADEAFKKAAEADAQRAKEAASAPKKGWGLGGWFGGGKKEAAPEASQPGKPIRAKLGEASSFVYDPDLKRWVNKKGGGDAVPTPSATPPPPRAAGPPRTASGPAGMVTSVPRPPSAPGVPPPMRSSQSLSNMNQIVSQTEPGPPGPSNLAAPPALNRTVSNGSITMAPPSRPGTSMSNASSIDDLLGPPTGARKGAAKGKKKGRGYIDVMGEKK